MILSSGRDLHKLRIQLLESCNFKCMYCMPEGTSTSPLFLPSAEIAQISARLQKMGVDEVRLTGGEPLLRKDFLEIVRSLSDLNFKKLGVTTNGYHLESILDELKQTHLKHINISMDSLIEEKFNYLSKKKSHHKVIRSVHRAIELGFKVKINVVVLKGINDDELIDYLNFSKKYQVCVRFLELMKVGPGGLEMSQHFLSADDILNQLQKYTTLSPYKVPFDNTAIEYTSDDGAHIGIIASETKSFCNSCSRLRLTAKGELRPCLFKDAGISLRNLSEEDFEKAVHRVGPMKPTTRIDSIAQGMYAIGG